VPPTAEVKFHQKPKQMVGKPNITWLAIPLCYLVLLTSFEKITSHFGDINTDG
jgi:hypothetical protein